jgi:ketosteroid isomerase-like protein
MASVSDKEVRELLDRDEIRQLMYKYGHCWDNLDFRGWAECFTPDGTYWEGSGLIFKGYDELLSYCQDTSPRVQGRYHLQMNQYVQVEGDTALAHSYALIVEELTPVRSGTYDDRLVRTDDGWKFEKRTVTCLYPSFLPIEGNDMASWLFSDEVGGGWQHRSKWRQQQYNLPPAFFQGIAGVK